MIKTKNKKLFALVMDKKFETGEYNFETSYGFSLNNVFFSKIKDK